MQTGPDTLPDPDVAYRAVSGRDPRWDGRLFVGVRTTGIYCRPSCPSRTPRPDSCTYFWSAAACVAAGFRACRRCRPDALPGSRRWDLDGDLADRALRLIADGALDDGSVGGLADRLGVSERHLHRLLVARVGASPVQLARTRRAQVARMLLEATPWPMPDVAFAAGFSSVRQFNDVLRVEYAATPSALRARGIPERWPTRAGGTVDEGPGPVFALRHATPIDLGPLLGHIAARSVPALEEVTGSVVRRLVPGPRGPAVVEVILDGAHDGARGRGPRARIRTAHLADLPHVVTRLRHWLDLDADPRAVRQVLEPDPLLGPLVEASPGLRVPGTVDPPELVLRTVLGQQVSVAGARTLAGRLVERWGEPGPEGLRAFPAPAALAEVPVDELRTIGLTGARAVALAAVAHALAAGLDVGPGCDRVVARRELLALPGVGPWTVEYVALRAMADPDAFPAHDLVLRRVLGVATPAEALARAEAWRPWRGYAAQHLWTSAARRGVPAPGSRSDSHPDDTRTHEQRTTP